MATPPLSKELAKEALAALDKCHGNKVKAAELLGIPRNTLLNRLQAAKRYDMEIAAQPIVDETVELKDRIRSLEAQIAGHRRETLDERYIREKILDLKEGYESISPPDWLAVNSSGKHSQSVPTLVLSDLHWGEVVDLKQMSGVNEYNIDIANRRLKTVITKSVSLLQNHISNTNYPGFVLCLGGDMLAGDIHEELTNTNDVPVFPALLNLMEALIAAIKLLADEFGYVYIPCVAGNHGRTTRKPRAKQRNETNLDWLLYQFLTLHFQEDDRIVVDSPIAPELTYKVYNHTYHLCHGDQLGKGGDGLIGFLGPVVRGDHKRRSLQSQLNNPYNTLIHGHYHTYAATQRFISNGCFKAGSPVTMRDGRMKPIEQVLIGDEVVTREGNIRKVVDAFSRANASRLVVLKCGSKHSEIRLTPNHRVWAIKASTVRHWVTQGGTMTETLHDPIPGWIESANLSVGDYVEIPAPTVTVDSGEYTHEFCRLIGFYLAEGSVSGPGGKLHHVDFSLHRDEELYANFIVQASTNKFGKARHYLPRTRPTSRSVVIDSVEASEYMVAVAGKGCEHKRLRDDIMLLPPNKQLEVLIGWLLGDGHTTQHGRYKAGVCVSGTTVSRDLIEQMRIIALRCGFFASINALAPGVNGRRKRTAYTLMFSGETARALAKHLDEYSPEIHALKRSKPTDFKSIEVDGRFFARLTDVWIENHAGLVYNLTVDEDHTYIVNGVGVANSLVGYDEYALANGFSFEVPQQAFWLTHPDYGVTFSMPIHAEEPKKIKPRPWVSMESRV